MSTNERTLRPSPFGAGRLHLLRGRRLLGILLLVGLLLLAVGCSKADQGAEAPDAPDVPEAVVPEEPDEPVAQGDPELVWSADYDNVLSSVAVAPDGSAVVAGEYLTGYVHQLATGDLINVYAFEHTAEDLAFSPDGKTLAAGLTLGKIPLIDYEKNEERGTLEGGYNVRVAFSPDGKSAAATARSKDVVLWGLSGKKKLATLSGPGKANDWVMSLEYHPDGKRLAASHWSGDVNIWDVEAKKIVRTINTTIDAGILSNIFKFSPDGETVAYVQMTDWEHYVRIGKADDEEVTHEFKVGKSVADLDFSPDGSMLFVTAKYDRGTIRDVSSGELLFTLGHTVTNESDWPNAGVFTPDGGHVAVVRWNGGLELWRLPGAEELVAPPVDLKKEPPPLSGDVLFDTGSAKLKASADSELAAYAKDLREAVSEATITFIGHTDSRGSAASNKKLSLDRAKAIQKWFTDWAKANGASDWTFKVDGRGDKKLKVPDVDAEGNFLDDAGALNRRVEIVLDSK